MFVGLLIPSLRDSDIIMASGVGGPLHPTTDGDNAQVDPGYDELESAEPPEHDGPEGAAHGRHSKLALALKLYNGRNAAFDL